TTNGLENIQLGISTFEVGNQFTPSFSVAYGQSISVSDSISVFVSLVAVDTSKPFKDIYPIFDNPLTAAEKWQLFWNKILAIWYVFLILLLLIIGLIWVVFFRKKKKKQEPEVVKEVIPAHILAERKLDELEGKQLWQNGNQKEYNVQLTEIIQEYISDRYNVPTKEKTSSEILHSIRFVEINELNKNNLRQLLMLSDLVKFAKEEPTPEENNTLLSNARQFVETTKNQSLS
ncbi:MAG: hypothetical protein ACPGVD_09395, partial [Flavobacteriales bacterium]